MAFSISDIFFYNPFAKFFKSARPEDEKKDQQEIKNSQGISSEELLLGRVSDYEALTAPGSQMTYIGIQFEQYFANKSGRIAKYREMSFYPEISDALDTICDEAIIPDTDGNIVSLEIEQEVPNHIEEKLREIWNYLIGEVFSFTERGWDLFRKWLVEAELYIELILNEDGTNIIGIKVLPNHTMIPVYEENKIVAYMQQAVPRITENQQDSNYKQPSAIMFDKSQVVYTNYGLYGVNQLDVRGYLDAAIRVYNQLKSLEDAVVVYRLVRAPERRVWNISTGKMPKGKAEEYIKGLIQRYKKRIVYDSETGAMNAAMNVQSMTEDFWFAKNEEGQGTTVETIGGGMNLGEIEDVNYFLKKLYKTLKLPTSRWLDIGNASYSSGKTGEITREEIKFSRFIERQQNRFKYILLDSYITLLRLRGIDERYIDHSFFEVRFTESNLFKEYKELELTETKFAALTTMAEFIYDPEQNAKGYFSQEYALRKYFMMNDDEYISNKKLLDKEKVDAAARGLVQPGGTIAGSGEGLGGSIGPQFGGGEIGGGVTNTPGLGTTETTPEFGTEENPGIEGIGTPEETAPSEMGGDLLGSVPVESVEFNKLDKKSVLLESWLVEDSKIRNKLIKN